MNDWNDVWQEIREALRQQPVCPDHSAYPCIRTLRQGVLNDIVRIDEFGIVVQSHRTGNPRELLSRDFKTWWEKLEQQGAVSINPGKSPRGTDSVLFGAILAVCLPTRVKYDGVDQITLIKSSPRMNDVWGYRRDSGAAAINTVLLEADGPLTEQQIVARVRDHGLPERGGVASHLWSLRQRGWLTKTPFGYVRVGNHPQDRIPLNAADADRSDSSDIEPYTPENVDRRPIVERQIRERRGQQPFRDSLRERYGDRCVVTGCRVLDVLEAAHIKPYRGENDNHPENGLLLRADIHTLFDLHLLGIEPSGLRIELHPTITGEYGFLAGKVLAIPSDRRPSHEALEDSYRLFRGRGKSPGEAP